MHERIIRALFAITFAFTFAFTNTTIIHVILVISKDWKGNSYCYFLVQQ